MSILIRSKSKKKLFLFVMVAVLFLTILQPGFRDTVNAETSGDAYVTYDSDTKTWTIGTDDVEKKVQLNGSGQFMLTQFKNKNTNRDYIQGTQNSEEFSIKVGNTTYTGASTGWVYDSYSATVQDDDSIKLSIIFHNNVVGITRNYEVFPNTGVIKEWSEFKNVSGSSQNFSSPYIFQQRVMQNDISDVDFYYTTGGGNFTGSWILKKVTMTSIYARTFNSTETPEVQTVDGQNFNNTGCYYNGTAVYDEFFILRNREEEEGMWLVFDYNGHWYAKVGNYGTKINLGGYVSMTDYSVANNASITGPKATIGVFEGDIDDMGNIILDYVYRYHWDYYDEDYCDNGTWQWTVSPQEPKAFASTNYNRYIGGKIVHVDAYWYDRVGDWDENIASDDIDLLVEYAQKNGARIKLWMPPWQADPGSDVATNHPDYICTDPGLTFYGYILNLAKSEVKTWILDMLDDKQVDFGDYMLRVDGMPAYTVSGSDNDMLQQSHNYFAILKEFRDNNPDAGLNGCASGGETAMMETIRYVDSMQLTDGGSMHYTGYYNCLRSPIDKLGHFFYYGPGACPDGSDTRFNTLESKSSTVKENARKRFERERFLKQEGLAGRWVKIYRPTINGGKDKTYFLQKMNSDSTKGLIMLSVFCPYFDQSFTIYPKGLIAGTNYTVRSTEGSASTSTQTGSYWMTNGVSVTTLEEGELITFNISNIPGESGDSTNPTAPSNVEKKTSVYVGKYGVELNWTAGSDNNFLSYYEIFKNDVSVDKVSRGTFYFTTDGSISDTWKVRTVDGDGNVSSQITASLDGGATPAPTPTSTPTPITKHRASDGFSSTQGQDNWQYLQQNTVPAGNYMYLFNMDYDSVNGRYQGEETYCLIGSSWQHPESNYNSVRKWWAPEDCRVLINGTARKAESGGDGVNVYIRKGHKDIAMAYEDLWTETISGSDTTGEEHNIVTDLVECQPLYFVVNKNSTAYVDATVWDPDIYIGASHTSSDEFSGTQGTDSWYYQQWNGSTYSNMTWDSQNSRWYGSEAYCLIGNNWQHPDSNYASARKWVAPNAATLEIRGNVKMDQTGGDGVVVTIKKNGISLWTKTISGDDTTTGEDFQLYTNVAVNDAIYFIVNKNSTTYYDSTLWDPTITEFK